MNSVIEARNITKTAGNGENDAHHGVAGFDAGPRASEIGRQPAKSFTSRLVDDLGKGGYIMALLTFAGLLIAVVSLRVGIAQLQAATAPPALSIAPNAAAAAD